MTPKFFAIMTNLGAAKLANAVALGTQIKLSHLAVGDGGGKLPVPEASQTALVHEVRRAPLNTVTTDPANNSHIVAEQIIPETEGGFWIREMGLFDEDGTLIAVCNTPETYKPVLQQGSGRTQVLRMVVIVSSTDAVALKIDPAVVLATRKYVDDSVLVVRQHADRLMKNHVATADPHKQYLKTAALFSEIKTAGKVPQALENLGITAASFSGRLLGKRIFTAPGNISYKPSPGTKQIKIIVTGGGGMGYGFLGWGSNFKSRGSGGGAGGTVLKWLNVDETKTYAGVVGRGSDISAASSSSSFNGQITAGNGLNGHVSAGGAGGSAVGGDINLHGGDGSDAPGLANDSLIPWRGGSGEGGCSYWGGGIRSGEDLVSRRSETFGVGGSGILRATPYIGNLGSHGVIYIEEYS